eukprot:scaffold81004_cov18-Prasinocladus_malaysianus.AAC.1
MAALLGHLMLDSIIVISRGNNPIGRVAVNVAAETGLWSAVEMLDEHLRLAESESLPSSPEACLFDLPTIAAPCVSPSLDCTLSLSAFGPL